MATLYQKFRSRADAYDAIIMGGLRSDVLKKAGLIENAEEKERFIKQQI